MGCTDSSVVLENKNKNQPKILTLPQNNKNNQNIILGEVSNNKFVCHLVQLPQESNQAIQIIQRQLPLLIAQQQPKKLRLPNFGQLTKIGNSGVYILTGGINFSLDYIYSSTYLFDSKLNVMYPLPQHKQARYTHSAIYAHGSIFLLGGRYFGDDNKALLDKCQKLNLNVYDQMPDQKIVQSIKQSTTLNWQQIPKMNLKRCSLISLVYNNRIYALGGYTGEYQRSPSIEYYDLSFKQQKWIMLNVELPFGIQSSTCLVSSQNQVIIFGGNSDSGPMDTVLTLNLLEGHQSIKTNHKLISKKILHKMFHNKNLYFLGGNNEMTVQMYQLQQNNKRKLQENSQVKQKNDNLLKKYYKSSQIFESLTHASKSQNMKLNKGIVQKQESSFDDQIAIIFGTSTQPFILELNITVPYANYHPVPLSIKLFALQGTVYVKQIQQYLLFGGITDSQEAVSQDTYSFSLKNPSKSKHINKMKYKRYAFGFLKINNFIYAIGGGSSDQQGQLTILNKCQRINIIKGSNSWQQWQQIADLPVGLISPMVLNWKNSLYVFGGMKHNRQRFNNIIKYNQQNNSWKQLNFKFQFGLQASSIYQYSNSQYYIFGGRLINGDSKTIWSLSLIDDGNDCVFQQKGKMRQPKCLHHVYKPKHQDFLIILGSQKQVLSFYDLSKLQAIELDVLASLKKLFLSKLKNLRDITLQNYSIVTNQ